MYLTYLKKINFLLNLEGGITMHTEDLLVYKQMNNNSVTHNSTGPCLLSNVKHVSAYL
jgi:hypothetical protein